MDVRHRGWVLALAALAVAGTAGAQESPAPAFTPELVAQGKKLFEGRGLCTACHGPKGRGGVGPDLTDGEWWHGDGSYEAIVQQILSGVPVGKARSGVPMPPKGGSTLSEAEVRAVAAYVYSLRGATEANAGSARGATPSCPRGGHGGKPCPGPG